MNKDKLKKFLIASIYGLCSVDCICDLRENSDDFMFYDKETETNYCVGKKFVYEYLDKLTEIESNAKLNKRIAFVIDSEILFNAQSTTYYNHLMIFNYIKLLNDNNIGVDIITDKNVLLVCNKDLLELDVRIFFYCDTLPCEDMAIEDMLINTIRDYAIMNPSTIKYIADDLNTCKILNKSTINNNLKLALVHAQSILDFPNSMAIKDDSDYVLDFLTFLGTIDYDILTTSQESYDYLKNIAKDINQLHYIPETYFNIEHDKHYLFNLSKVHNRDVLCIYTNIEDLSYIVDSVMPLGLDLTILIDNNTNVEAIEEELKMEKVFTNYRVIDISFRNIIQDSYTFMVDFRKNIDYDFKNYTNKYIFSNEISNQEENENIRYVEKSNVIDILKAMLELDEENMFNDDVVPKIEFKTDTDTNKQIENFYLLRLQ